MCGVFNVTIPDIMCNHSNRRWDQDVLCPSKKICMFCHQFNMLYKICITFLTVYIFSFVVLMTIKNIYSETTNPTEREDDIIISESNLCCTCGPNNNDKVVIRNRFIKCIFYLLLCRL